MIKKFITNIFKKIFSTKEIKTYPALDVAKYVVYKCSKDNQCVSNMQLNFILYYCQKYYLENYKHVLFTEDIHLELTGPCVEKVYNYFCGFGAMEIYYLPDVESIHDIDSIIDDKRRFSWYQLLTEFKKEEDNICK